MDKKIEVKKTRLNTSPSLKKLKSLKIGDIVYLDGIIYTAREGVYKRVLEEGHELPFDIPNLSATNFHCSPAASKALGGGFKLSAVSATASFRFSKWIGPWLKKSNSKIIVGKGGMRVEDYHNYFIPNNAIYLTTVGYGTGALLGRSVEKIIDVYWQEELGLAQAMWILKVKKFGPLIVEGDLNGQSLFERENKKISAKIHSIYKGSRPAVLKRFGETDDRQDELI